MFLFKKESILTEYILKDYLLLYFITNIIALPDAHHFFPILCAHFYLIKHRKTETMKTNVGMWDRILRLIAGVFLIAYLASQNVIGLFGNLLLVGSFILIITSFWGFCPVYAFFRFSTTKKEEKVKQSKNIRELIS